MITALVRTCQRSYLPIEDWQALRAALEAGDLEAGFLVSKLILAHPAGALELEDRMEPLVQNLCLQAPRQLLAGQRCDLQHWDYPAALSLQPEGDTVLLSGDLLRPAVFSKRELIAVLLDCAAQVMALMRRLHEHDPAYLSAYPYFVELLDECRRCYAAAYGQEPEAASG